MLIDTHCHLDFDRFDADREDLLARATAVGVQRIIIPMIDLTNGRAILQLADQYDQVYVAVGIHPNSTADWQDSWLSELQTMAQHPKVVAIGEIGLDYYWNKAEKAVQQHAFRQQLALAATLQLPVIVHNREANDDVVRLLAESPLAGQANPGVLHSFLADEATATAVLEMGFYLGITGPITYKKSAELRQIVAQVPFDRLLIETDAPFLAPEIHGKRPSRNEPALVAHVAARIAQVRGVETAVVAQQTSANALRLFGRMQPTE